MTLTRGLADYLCGIKLADIPDEKIRDIKRLILDYLGVALSGSGTETGRLAAEFAIELEGVKQASIIGRGQKVPAVNAAFANAIASHSIELDDVDDEALFHFSPPIVSAALAVAEMVHASGSDFLVAVLAGCDLMARLSRATNPSLRDRGFHTTPTCGVFGAAAAAGKLLALTPDQMTSTLGLAGAQASGLMEFYGTSMQKRFNPGAAARNGVTAACLASKGFTGADTIIEGVRGFARAFSDHFDPMKLTEGLGKDFKMGIEFKAYSSARPIHNAVDCALTIRHQHAPRVEEVSEIVFYRHPAWADFHLIHRPRTYHEAQVSLPYSAAVALIDGAALLPQYSEERIRDSRVLALAEKVTVLKDASLPRGVSCRMILKMLDGKTYSTQVDYPKGSIQNPMTDDELKGKFRLLAMPCLGPEKSAKTIDLVQHLERAKDVSSLLQLFLIG